MSLNHEVPHHIDRLRDTVDLSADMARLTVHLAFEDAMDAADERLITRAEAIKYMNRLAPVILSGEATV